MKILILCTTLIGVVILNTLVALFLSWHASLIIKTNFYATGNSSKLGNSLGVVKMEAFEDSNFM